MAGDIALVECKLADNPEIKRKVIGQIFEYAAFLSRLTYEDLDEIIARKTGRRLAQLTETRAKGGDWKPEEFRAAIESNLAEGRFLLIIAVDRMDDTLKATIEWLNASALKGVSLHALEMNRLSDDELEILVPHVFGSRPPDAGSGERRAWTEEDFLKQAAEKSPPRSLAAIKGVLSVAKIGRVAWGTGKTASFTLLIAGRGKTISALNLFADGKLFIGWADIRKKAGPAVTERFARELESAEGLRGIDLAADSFPSHNVADALPDETCILALKRALEGLRNALEEHGEDKGR